MTSSCNQMMMMMMTIYRMQFDAITILFLFFYLTTADQVLLSKKLQEDPGRLLLDALRKYGNNALMNGVIMENEILCNCTEIGCDDELTHIHPERYRGLCRSKGGVCTKQIYRLRKNDEEIKTTLSCLESKDMQPIDRPFLCEPTTRIDTNVACCRHQSFCNSKLDVRLINVQPPTSPNNDNRWQINVLLIIIIIVAIGACFIVIFRANIIHRIKFLSCYAVPSNKLCKLDQSKHDADISSLQILLQHATDAVGGEFTNSGSGSGLPQLVQRTIARQIELKNEVGRGRFGEVWLGIWKGESVAVKIFSSRDEKSWFREVEVYQTNMLQHQNILSFIASDNKDTGTCTQLWVISEYHAFGSLSDYLSVHTVSTMQLCRMVRTIANGLAFLHAEITGTQNKPAIAHRDLKSKNILVRADLSCCIADLGLAVRYSNGVLDLPDNNKCGTVRYLPPEVLDNAMNQHHFDAYRMGDIYSLGLVIWEITSRRTSDDDGLTNEYQLPFFDIAPHDPTLEEMRTIVCVNNIRPALSLKWQNDSILAEMSRIMCECWSSVASARLSAMNVRIAVDRISTAIIQ